MPRPQLGADSRGRGRALGDQLRRARSGMQKTARAISEESRVPLDTVRAIEAGRVANPGFFTIAALADASNVGLDSLAEVAVDPSPSHVLKRKPRGS